MNINIYVLRRCLVDDELRTSITLETNLERIQTTYFSCRSLMSPARVLLHASHRH